MKPRCARLQKLLRSSYRLSPIDSRDTLRFWFLFASTICSALRKFTIIDPRGFSLVRSIFPSSKSSQYANKKIALERLRKMVSEGNNNGKRATDRSNWLEHTRLIRGNAIRENVLQDEEIDRIADKLFIMQEREDILLPALRQQLAEAEKGIENILNAIKQGLYNASAQKRLDDLEKQKEELEVSILKAELARPKYTKDEMVHWISRFKYSDVDDVDYRRQIIDTFINSIQVFDNKLMIIYNYKEGML